MTTRAWSVSSRNCEPVTVVAAPRNVRRITAGSPRAHRRRPRAPGRGRDGCHRVTPAACGSLSQIASIRACYRQLEKRGERVGLLDGRKA